MLWQNWEVLHWTPRLTPRKVKQSNNPKQNSLMLHLSRLGWKARKRRNSSSRPNNRKLLTQVRVQVWIQMWVQVWQGQE